MKPLQANLGGEELGAEQVFARAHAGIEPLLLDGGQPGGIAILVIEDFDPAPVGVELNVVQRRIKDHLLSRVGEGQLGRT